MPSTEPRSLPDIGEALAPVLARVVREEWPLLIALAERMAARRYRGWADDPTVAAHASALRACAVREEEIATRVEALHADAARTQERLLAAHPELEVINRVIFAGRPLADQLLIQARGERLGAAMWRLGRGSMCWRTAKYSRSSTTGSRSSTGSKGYIR